MPWAIILERKAQKDIKALARTEQIRIQTFLNLRLAVRDNPRELGEALTGPWSGYWKYRVGDYRLIARIEDHVLRIVVIRVANRREAYR